MVKIINIMPWSKGGDRDPSSNYPGQIIINKLFLSFGHMLRVTPLLKADILNLQIFKKILSSKLAI